MTTRSRRWLGATVALSFVLVGCSSESANDVEKRDQHELAKSLVDAAASALGQDDAATAAGYYRGALAREPANVDAAVGLMQSLRLVGSLDEAREVAEKALAANPDNAAVEAEGGKIKLAIGQLDQAIKLLKRAVQADAKDWRSRSALGLAYDRVGEYGQADQYYREALAISPDNAAVLNNYALSRAMANDLAAARSLLQRAAAAPDADMRVRQNLALVYALSGDMNKAEELARHDLPPALVGEQLDYYRHLAATATLPIPPMQMPALKSPDHSAADGLAPAIVSVAPARTAPAPDALAAQSPSLAPPPPAPEAAPAPARPTPPPKPVPAAARALPAPVAAATPAPALEAPRPFAVAVNPQTDRRDANNRFTVQVGSFLSVVSARRAFSRFAAKGVTTKITYLADRDGRYWFVVRAGEFETGEEADYLLHRVRAMGCADAFVVRHEVSAETRA